MSSRASSSASACTSDRLAPIALHIAVETTNCGIVARRGAYRFASKVLQTSGRSSSTAIAPALRQDRHQPGCRHRSCARRQGRDADAAPVEVAQGRPRPPGTGPMSRTRPRSRSRNGPKAGSSPSSQRAPRRRGSIPRGQQKVVAARSDGPASQVSSWPSSVMIAGEIDT